jgi:hypothetical protein
VLVLRLEFVEGLGRAQERDPTARLNAFFNGRLGGGADQHSLARR